MLPNTWQSEELLFNDFNSLEKHEEAPRLVTWLLLDELTNIPGSLTDVGAWY